MKTVKHKKDGTIKRVTDAKALELTKEEWEYCPKSIFKARKPISTSSLKRKKRRRRKNGK